MDVVAFLSALDFVNLVVLFWYTTLLEFPRYVIGAIAAGIAVLSERPRQPPDTNLTVSVILAGHNEAQSLEACVGGLAEQTLTDRSRLQVVVVDDGSTDGMANVAHDLRGEGLVDEVIRLRHRGGKSAAVNLGLGACRATLSSSATSIPASTETHWRCCSAILPPIPDWGQSAETSASGMNAPAWSRGVRR